MQVCMREWIIQIGGRTALLVPLVYLKSDGLLIPISDYDQPELNHFDCRV
jgi:hypothetical protein